MSKVIVYLRISTDMQDTETQKVGVVEFCQRRGFEVARWVEDTASGGKDIKARKLGAVVKGMKEGDVLIASEISRLSRNMLDLMGLLQKCMEKGIKIYTVKEGFELGDNINSKVLAFAFGLTAEIERALISARTKEGLARRKASGIKLGPAFGSRKKNPIMKAKHDMLLKWADAGLNQIAIAKKLKVCRQTVAIYCKAHSIDLRAKKEKQKVQKLCLDPHRKMIEQWLAAGESQKEISKRFGVAESTIRRFLTARKIKPVRAKA